MPQTQVKPTVPAKASQSPSDTSQSPSDTLTFVSDDGEVIVFTDMLTPPEAKAEAAEPPLRVEADFPAPRSKALMAEEQRRFVAASGGPYYDVELPEED